MQFYIYGRGRNGAGIALFLDVYYPNSRYVFIDDSVKESSLECIADNIKDDDKLLIASTLHYDKMATKCKGLGLDYENGIDW